MSSHRRLRFPEAGPRSPGDLVLRVGELELVGMSRATVATAFAIEAFKVAVDMGRCSRLLAAQEAVLLSHCHSDHVAGLIAWLSARVAGQIADARRPSFITNYVEAEAHALLLRKLGRALALEWLLAGGPPVLRHPGSRIPPVQLSRDFPAATQHPAPSHRQGHGRDRPGS